MKPRFVPGDLCTLSAAAFIYTSPFVGANDDIRMLSQGTVVMVMAKTTSSDPRALGSFIMVIGDGLFGWIGTTWLNRT
jgi:hypothetical protein